MKPMTKILLNRQVYDVSLKAVCNNKSLQEKWKKMSNQISISVLTAYLNTVTTNPTQVKYTVLVHA